MKEFLGYLNQVKKINLPCICSVHSSSDEHRCILQEYIISTDNICTADMHISVPDVSLAQLAEQAHHHPA